MTVPTWLPPCPDWLATPPGSYILTAVALIVAVITIVEATEL